MKIYYFIIINGPLFNKTRISFTKGSYVSSLVITGYGIWIRRFLNINNVFLLICYHFIMEWTFPLISFVLISPVVLEEKSWKCWQCIFAIPILSPLGKRCEKALPSNIVEFSSPKDIFVKFGWKWLVGSGEEYENLKSIRRRQRRRTTYTLS